MNLTEVLVQELRKPVIKNFKRRKIYVSFKSNNWAADLAEMGSLSTFTHGFSYLMGVMHVFTKYLWVKHLIDKQAKAVLDSYVRKVNESKCKPSKL